MIYINLIGGYRDEGNIHIAFAMRAQINKKGGSPNLATDTSLMNGLWKDEKLLYKFLVVFL